MVYKLVIKGLVQGIGFRPYVAELAEKLNIDGNVRNSGGIVTVVASADVDILKHFKEEIIKNVPSPGIITEIKEEVVEDEEVEKGFYILESNEDIEESLPLIPVDIATCKRCESELLDEKNRRYGHPFISCTLCGPRYSILKRLPYDRETITMESFEMCPECAAEYVKNGDIRRHAQTIACQKCGPRLEGDLDEAANVIKAGGIVAIKDIGGYHLACNPFNEEAASFLRRLKHREAKAFAVMFKDVEEIKLYAEVSDAEAELLKSPARPIVLVHRRPEGGLAQNVCLNSPDIGAMLPCNPLQILMIKKCGPLVMTSGNGSGDVLEIDDTAMREWLEKRFTSQEMKGGSYYILSHNREILRPLDDSVMKVVKGRQMFIRRARGFVPNPIKTSIKGEIFAAGGDLKSSFCFVKDGLAYVSQYLGDLQSVSCQSFYKKEKLAMEEIFGFSSSIVARDKHPMYFSTGLFENGISIQHHKAHAAAVIAENNLEECLCFAFDGTGYGDDGSIWGSEIFTWDGKNMDRVGHLKPVELIGGDEGAKNCNTILKGYLYNCGLLDEEDIIYKGLKMKINSVTSTSMGRLFDAVSGLLEVCDYNTYEGQGPIELEFLAARADKAYDLKIGEDGDCSSLFKELLSAKGRVSSAELALGFIYAVADFVVDNAKKHSMKKIALSGGTFNNRLLLERCIELLETEGYEVYINQQLPPGDQSICLGQAYLAGFVNI